MARIFSGGGLTLNAVIGGLGATDNRALRSDGTGGQSAQGSDVVIDDSGNIGTNAVTPTHSLTVPSTGTGGAWYNTADTTTNYERGVVAMESNRFVIGFDIGGTGSTREIRIRTASSSGLITVGPSTIDMGAAGGTTTAGGILTLSNKTTFSASSGTQRGMSITGTVNQTGTAAYTAYHANPTTTAIGSGGGKLLHMQTSSTDRFIVDTNGKVTVCAGTATPAGGATTAALLFGTTAGFGIYYGSGAPSVTAGQGSWYMRSDGSTGITRAYVATDSAGTWTPFTTVA